MSRRRPGLELDPAKLRAMADTHVAGIGWERLSDADKTVVILYSTLAAALERVAALEEVVRELRGGTLPSDDGDPVVGLKGKVVGHVRPRRRPATGADINGWFECDKCGAASPNSDFVERHMCGGAT